MKSPIVLLLIFCSLCCLAPSCGPSGDTSSSIPEEEIVEDNTPKPIVASQPTAEENTSLAIDTIKIDHLTFPWLTAAGQSGEATQSLAYRIATPQGFQRTKTTQNSFADWLRHLPLKAEDAPVKLFDGRLKGRQDVHAAVVEIDVGRRDLQQCADAVMRLRAEYLYGKKDYPQIHFNFTSGDRVSFDDWRYGRKPRIEGNRVRFSNRGTEANNSYTNFKAYLQQIFNYAGTASLSKELRPIKVEDMQIGDVFILGGFPGHAVIVVDMAENIKGEKLFLIAQSYMPAQNIHILKNPNASELSPWYSLDFGPELYTPEWTFTSAQLHRFTK